MKNLAQFLSFCLTIILAAPNVWSQVSSVNISGSGLSGHITYFRDKESPVIHGTTYLNESFMAGALVLKSGESVPGLFRLNALRKEVEIATGNDTVIFKDALSVKYLKLGGLTFVSSIVIEKSGKRSYINTHFLNLIADGEVQLLKKYNVNLFQNTYVPNYMAGGGDGLTYYTMQKHYYYRFNDGSAARLLERKPKSIAGLFGADVKEVKKLLHSQRLNLMKEPDLVRLFNLLNEKEFN
jgi:hypothetical protein